MQLRLLEGLYAVVQLGPQESVPSWAAGDFVSVTRSRRELSLVVDESRVPESCRAERGWRILEVRGPLEFSEVGVLASLTSTLAEAGISLFALSTFDTDYLLIKDESVDRAVSALRVDGHAVDATVR